MKSHVSLEQAVCPICGTAHDTGVILLDKRLLPTLERTTATHWDLCPEHKRLEKEGYIALIECSNKEQPRDHNDVHRTGNIAHVRREAWAKVFNVPPPPGPLAFCEVGTIAELQAKLPPAPSTVPNH